MAAILNNRHLSLARPLAVNYVSVSILGGALVKFNFDIDQGSLLKTILILLRIAEIRKRILNCSALNLATTVSLCVCQ